MQGLNVDLRIMPLGGLIINSVGMTFRVGSDGDAF